MLRLKAAESFLEISQCTQRTHQRGSAEKSGLRDVKRANFFRYWRRSGLKNPDKPKIFIKKNVRNHPYHQFYPVFAKIRINRGLLYKIYKKIYAGLLRIHAKYGKAFGHFPAWKGLEKIFSLLAVFPLRKYYTEEMFILVSMNNLRLSYHSSK